MNAEIKDRLLRIRWWMFHWDRRQLYRWYYKATRPVSDPYISGDGFRRMARHIYDETTQKLRPEAVRSGDLVFVSTEYARRFFQEIAPRIESRFRLITHNSDVPVDEALARLALDSVEIWFAQNNSHANDMVVPIPIGLENKHLYVAGVPADFDSVRACQWSKKPRILSGFTIATNPEERQRAYEAAQRSPCIDQLPERLNQRAYLHTLATYQFLLCPPGNGLDTHRTWEAMYLGAIPIVKDSVAVRFFRGLGLPMWVIGDWDEVLAVSERDLAAKYLELKDGFNAPALYMDYWRKLIRESNDLTMSTDTSRGIRAAAEAKGRAGSVVASHRYPTDNPSAAQQAPE